LKELVPEGKGREGEGERWGGWWRRGGERRAPIRRGGGGEEWERERGGVEGKRGRRRGERDKGKVRVGGASMIPPFPLQFVYFTFHYMKGIPFEVGDQGVSRRLTHWEQLDDGEQFTAGKKFVIGITILL
jgi:hypothetical protein